MLTVNQNFIDTYPAAHIGVLVMHDVNNVASPSRAGRPQTRTGSRITFSFC